MLICIVNSQWKCAVAKLDFCFYKSQSPCPARMWTDFFGFLLLLLQCYHLPCNIMHIVLCLLLPSFPWRVHKRLFARKQESRFLLLTRRPNLPTELAESRVLTLHNVDRDSSRSGAVALGPKPLATPSACSNIACSKLSEKI